MSDPSPVRSAMPGAHTPSHSKPPLAPKLPRSPASPSAAVNHEYINDNSSNASATPSELLLSVPLAKKNSDLSDLSGSLHGGGSVQSEGVPRHISTDGGVASSRQPWKQPHVLSEQPPKDKGVVLVERNEGGVELVKPNKQTLQSSADNRTPLVVLLMDPSRKWYELLLLWIDVSTDTVRDVFQSVGQKIPEQWRQDYDGFVQLRSGTANQLINCLPVKKYDVAPYEVWIAKPTSLAASITRRCADNLLTHLRNLGVVSHGVGGLLSKPGENSPPRRKNKGATAPTNEGVLTLSLVARSRIYAPDGILKHHHAGMFLSFSPRFEPEVSPLQEKGDDDSSFSFTNLSGLSIDIGGKKEKVSCPQKKEVPTTSFSPLVTSSDDVPALNETDSVTEGGESKQSSKQRPHMLRRRSSEDTDKTRPARGFAKLKLLGNCFGKAECFSNAQAGSYDWNRPGSSSDYVPLQQPLETQTAMTESPTLPRQVGDSWTESEDEYSFVSNQDSFSPLISSRKDPFAFRHNKVTDCGV